MMLPLRADENTPTMLLFSPFLFLPPYATERDAAYFRH